MNDLATLSTSRFWAWSLDAYADAPVAAACIALQDRYALDVDMLLFALFAASRGRSLSQADIEQLDGAVDPWRRNVVRPLRCVRRWLQETPHTANDPTARLARSVLEREIEAEACQQDLMERTLPIADGSPDVRAAADNLVGYARFTGLRGDDALLAALATLVERTFAPLASTDAKALLASRWHATAG